ILEISTYYQVLGKAKFIESYPKEFSNLAEKNIKKVVLIAKESSQYDELEAFNKGEKNNLKQLMAELQVQVFVFDELSLEIEA
ncbi:MAG TPA: hypothetical protein VIK72_04705, partial [Clostridiaceae bacterium]